ELRLVMWFVDCAEHSLPFAKPCWPSSVLPQVTKFRPDRTRTCFFLLLAEGAVTFLALAVWTDTRKFQPQQIRYTLNRKLSIKSKPPCNRLWQESARISARLLFSASKLTKTTYHFNHMRKKRKGVA